MKKLSYFFIISTLFLVFACKFNQEPEDSFIIIKFDDEVTLPNNLLAADSTAYTNLQNQYTTLRNKLIDFHNLIHSTDSARVVQEPEFVTKPLNKQFKKKLDSVLFVVFKQKNLLISPIFDKHLIIQLQNKITLRLNEVTPSCLSGKPQLDNDMVANLGNFFKIDICLSQESSKKLVDILNSLNLPQLKFDYSIIKQSEKRGILTSIFSLIRGRVQSLSPSQYDSSFNFRKVMNIDALNFGSATSSKINGLNSNIVILETANHLDATHDKFKHIPNFSSLASRLSIDFGTGSSLTHATNTFGIIFSDINPTNDNKGSNLCKGVASDASLRKMVYFGEYKCGDKNLPPFYNALLQSIIDAQNGDILLIEFVPLTNLPVECDATGNLLIKTAMKLLGITVIEPVGNEAGNLDGVSKNNFEAILVGASDKNGNLMDRFSSSITCFAYGQSLLTTNPQNAYNSFGDTSGAAAIIAGLACDMQGYYFTEMKKIDGKGCYLTPQQMKDIFSKAATASNIKVIYQNRILNQGIPDAMELKRQVDKLMSPNGPI